MRQASRYRSYVLAFSAGPTARIASSQTPGRSLGVSRGGRRRRGLAGSRATRLYPARGIDVNVTACLP